MTGYLQIHENSLLTEFRKSLLWYISDAHICDAKGIVEYLFPNLWTRMDRTVVDVLVGSPSNQFCADICNIPSAIFPIPNRI